MADDDLRRRPPYRRLSSDRRREEIITAAVAVFGNDADAEVSIDVVAAAAGTSRSSVYRYFDGEGDLYEAAVRRVGTELVARLARVSAESPSAKLMVQIGLYFDFLEEYAGGYARFLSGGAARAPDAAVSAAKDVRDRIAELTYRTLRADEPGEMLRATVQSWIAAVEWAGTQWLRTGRPDRGLLEVLLSAQLATALVGASAFDPLVAQRVAWLMDVEPPDSPFGGMIRTLVGSFGREALPSLAKFLGQPESTPA